MAISDGRHKYFRLLTTSTLQTISPLFYFLNTINCEASPHDAKLSGKVSKGKLRALAGARPAGLGPGPALPREAASGRAPCPRSEGHLEARAPPSAPRPLAGRPSPAPGPRRPRPGPRAAVPGPRAPAAAPLRSPRPVTCTGARAAPRSAGGSVGEVGAAGLRPPRERGRPARTRRCRWPPGLAAAGSGPGDSDAGRATTLRRRRSPGLGARSPPRARRLGSAALGAAGADAAKLARPPVARTSPAARHSRRRAESGRELAGRGEGGGPRGPGGRRVRAWLPAGTPPQPAATPPGPVRAAALSGLQAWPPPLSGAGVRRRPRRPRGRGAPAPRPCAPSPRGMRPRLQPRPRGSPGGQRSDGRGQREGAVDGNCTFE